MSNVINQKRMYFEKSYRNYLKNVKVKIEEWIYRETR